MNTRDASQRLRLTASRLIVISDHASQRRLTAVMRSPTREAVGLERWRTRRVQTVCAPFDDLEKDRCAAVTPSRQDART